MEKAFGTLVRQRCILAPWLVRAAQSPLPPFRRFAKGLPADIAAVQAAVTLPWSQDPTVGQINRLKMLKRQMFGRARLDLLERHPAFPNRTNVQLAKALTRDTLEIRIWERGAGYTLASGSSSCGAASAAVRPSNAAARA